MEHGWIDGYLMDKKGVEKDLQADWNWLRYKVGGKMFAALCLDNENRLYYITIKLPPEEGAFLREQYEDILPGYYCNKQHWNSVRAQGQVPEALLRSMLDTAYETVFCALPKKKQREILGE